MADSEYHYSPSAMDSSSGGQIRTADLWVMSPTSCHCSTPQRKIYYSVCAVVRQISGRPPAPTNRATRRRSAAARARAWRSPRPRPAYWLFAEHQRQMDARAGDQDRARHAGQVDLAVIRIDTRGAEREIETGRRRLRSAAIELSIGRAGEI